MRSILDASAKGRAGEAATEADGFGEEVDNSTRMGRTVPQQGGVRKYDSLQEARRLLEAMN